MSKNENMIYGIENIVQLGVWFLGKRELLQPLRLFINKVRQGSRRTVAKKIDRGQLDKQRTTGVKSAF